MPLFHGPRNQRGYIMILFAAMLVPLIGLIALVVDVGQARVERSRLSAAVVSSALGALMSRDRTDLDPDVVFIEAFDGSLSAMLGETSTQLRDVDREGTPVYTVQAGQGLDVRVTAHASFRPLIIDRFQELSGVSEGGRLSALTIRTNVTIRRYGPPGSRHYVVLP